MSKGRSKVDWTLVLSDMEFYEGKFAEMFLIAVEDGDIPFSTEPEDMMIRCLDDMLDAYMITRNISAK